MKKRSNPLTPEVAEKKVISKAISGNSFSSLVECIKYLQDKMADYKFNKNGSPFYVFKGIVHRVPKFQKPHEFKPSI